MIQCLASKRELMGSWRNQNRVCNRAVFSVKDLGEVARD